MPLLAVIAAGTRARVSECPARASDGHRIVIDRQRRVKVAISDEIEIVAASHQMHSL